MSTDPAGPGPVRVAAPEEWPEIAELTTAVYATLAPAPPPPFWPPYLRSIAVTLTQPDDARRLVVDLDGRIAASTLLCPPADGPAGRGTNPYPELRLLAVRPEHRRRGLAGRLIEACEQLARDDGYDALTLHTTALMPTARDLYERRGYQRAPELDFQPSPDFVVWGYRRLLV